jgi:NTP pyrophosphatase (non-canonical NTP hydrolase)
MGKYKNEGNAALALAEECAEVIQVITKKHRFNGNWNEIPVGKDKSRLEELTSEMDDVIYQWNRFKQEQLLIVEEDEESEEQDDSCQCDICTDGAGPCERVQEEMQDEYDKYTCQQCGKDCDLCEC